MSILRCANGHFFDDTKYAGCPHCSWASAAAGGSPIPSGGAVRWEPPMDRARGEKTIGLFQQTREAGPVAGWLVRTDGPERGRDFRLHAGRNFVGRSPETDIPVTDNEKIAPSNHCSIVFEPKTNAFFLAPGEGADTLLNDRPLTRPETLRDEDILLIGGTTFVFIAFCKGERSWL